RRVGLRLGAGVAALEAGELDPGDELAHVGAGETRRQEDGARQAPRHAELQHVRIGGDLQLVADGRDPPAQELGEPPIGREERPALAFVHHRPPRRLCPASRKAARSRSSRSWGLVRYSSTPASKPRTRSIFSPRLVTMRIGVWAWRALARRARV